MLGQEMHPPFLPRMRPKLPELHATRIARFDGSSEEEVQPIGVSRSHSSIQVCSGPTLCRIWGTAP
jgi:hypothetical protein